MRHNLEHRAMGDGWHFSVMWREAVDFIAKSPNGGRGMLADCTLGEGGHSAIFLSEFPDMKVAGIERDPLILGRAQGRLAPFGERVSFYNLNFSGVRALFEGEDIRPDYFFFDFGISSFHYDKSGRGFGFARDEALDMRLDGEGQSAADIINGASEREISDMIFKYGEDRWGKMIARRICEAREEKLIETTGELAEIVLRAIPKRFHVKNIHPATRVFQALRIAVNDELSAIEFGISSALELLKPGGMMIAISFHSLEDRIVKHRFRQLATGCYCEGGKNCRCDRISRIDILTKKPAVPLEDETAANNRSRSARMRVCVKRGELSSIS